MGIPQPATAGDLTLDVALSDGLTDTTVQSAEPAFAGVGPAAGCRFVENEEEFQSILAEKQAEHLWVRLDLDTQRGWVHWIEHTGEVPQVRMNQAADRLLAGKNRPPRFGWLRTFLGYLLGDMVDIPTT